MAPVSLKMTNRVDVVPWSRAPISCGIMKGRLEKKKKKEEKEKISKINREKERKKGLKAKKRFYPNEIQTPTACCVCGS